MIRKFYEADGDFIQGRSVSPPNISRIRLQVNIDVDWKFFAILPALNINLHSKQLEFEWLFLGIYIG